MGNLGVSMDGQLDSRKLNSILKVLREHNVREYECNGVRLVLNNIVEAEPESFDLPDNLDDVSEELLLWSAPGMNRKRPAK
jgi:hypothetical protein